MRLAFMGTPDFAVPALEALIASGHEIAAVYTQPPRPAGRGKAERKSPVHVRAEAVGVPVRTPVSLKSAEAQREFSDLGLDAAVVVAYGLLLPQAVLDAPKYGCLNIHASLLPRWRGAAPIHRALMAGDTETGVCIMAMEAGLDTGPVYAREAVEIGPRDTTGSLHDRLAVLGARMVVDVLAALPFDPEPQDADGVTYAKKIDKAEARIDWTRPADEVDRLIRGLSPFPGAWSNIDGTRIKALLSETTDGAGAPGEVLDGLHIACGIGAVRLLEVQRAGRGPQDAEAFLRGFPLEPGTKL